MRKFFHSDIVPYVPGAQGDPKDFIKLNANETSESPSPRVLSVLSSERMKYLGFYGDPNCTELRKMIALKYRMSSEQVLIGNGADEILVFIMLAFMMENSSVCFPNITYEFYECFCKTFKIKYYTIPIKEDFTINTKAFIDADSHVILANPNSPTGIWLSIDETEKIIRSNLKRIVVIDEAYIDYGNTSVMQLVNKYDNLIVVHTMSKSRNLAGAHIGYCIAKENLIKELNKIRCSVNPYNMSDISLAIGIAAIEDESYYQKKIIKRISVRENFTLKMRELGFHVVQSSTNFVLLKHMHLDAIHYQNTLYDNGILVRHYDNEQINNYLRITIGTKQEMDEVINVTSKLLFRNEKYESKR